MKKIIGLLLVSFLLFGVFASFTYADVPSFDDNFSQYLTDDTPDSYGRKETVFNLCIDRNMSFMDNMRKLFYPNFVNVDGGDCGSSRGGLLWDVIRIGTFGLIFIYFVVAGLMFLFSSQEQEDLKGVARSFMYILYGAFLILGVTWLLGTVLNIENLAGSEDLIHKLQGGPDSLFYQILGFLKAAAFFVGLVMLIWYGFRTMQAMDQEEKIKNARSGVLHVIISLIFIKVIDYIFYIAQVPDFTTKATELIVEIAKVLGYLLGAFFVIYIFYAGFLLLTGSGQEEQMKKAKKILVTIILSSVVLFFFLLIVYQIFAEFA